MLRRRIEKLERSRPPAAGDLIERWERQAIASLSREDQALIDESYSAGRKRSDSAAQLAAVQRFQDALQAGIADVSDDELDRMIQSLDPELGPRTRVAELKP
jgi:hypothetical protein